MAQRLALEPAGKAQPEKPEVDSVAARYEAEIQSLSKEILDRYEEVTLVYRLSDLLATVLGEDAIARAVLGDAARVLGAREGDLWLRREDGGVRLAARVPEEREGVATLPTDALPALEEGRSSLREAGFGGEAVAVVPLPSGTGRPLGAIVLRGRSGNRSYRSGELKLLGAIASLTSAFVRNDRLAEKARLADVRRRELEIARQVHCGLLPHRDPTWPGLEIAGGFRAAEAVGGDYYGYFPRGRVSLGLAMADVSGHGVGPALYMAAVKGFVQAEAGRTDAPATILAQLNDALISEFTETDVFTTLVFVRLDAGGRRLRCSNGGHNPPVILRADGRAERLERGGPALGLLAGAAYEQESRDLSPGDVLLVYTDGVVEARDPRSRFYGLERLVAEAARTRGGTAAEIRDAVFLDLERFRGSASLRDDVTLVVVRAVGGETSGGPTS